MAEVREQKRAIMVAAVGRRTTYAGATLLTSEETMPENMKFLIGRQPILDRTSQIVARG